MSGNPKISVITVVYNGAEVIEGTIKNVLAQTYKNIEFIIIDGASKDNTLEIVNNYKSYLAKIISEPDKGLYDAMNKGLMHATGDYVIFINAGDAFYNHNVLENIFANKKSYADVYYGETVITDEQENEIGMRRLSVPKQLNWKSFSMGMLVCHQSIFIKRTIAEKYNTDYRLAADIDWIIRALKKTNKVENVNLVVSKFRDGGVSKNNIVKGLKERFKIMQIHYGLPATVFKHFIIGTKFLWFVGKNKRI